MTDKFNSPKQKSLDDAEGEWTVEVSKDILNLLHSAYYFSMKKENIDHSFCIKRVRNNQKKKNLYIWYSIKKIKII